MYNFKSRKGMTLIEVLIGSAIMIIVFVAIIGVFQTTIALLANIKMRIGALAVAQERVEYIKSFAYDDVGTVAGIPSGIIPQTETIVLNNVTYGLRTLIQYVDDDRDGSGVADENGIPADYKRVKAEVTWDFKGESKSVSLVTNVVPPGIETIVGGGTLIINVFDALGLPVEGADVHIVNNDLMPVVDITVVTNAAGIIMFPGSPANSNYEIIVSKSGYSTAQTYEVTAALPNPNPGHLTVLEGQTTVSSFQIDKVSTKIITTKSSAAESEWEDVFADTSMTSVMASTSVSSGKLELSGGATHEPVGYVDSESLTATDLYEWGDFTVDDVSPAFTANSYQVLYNNGSDWVLIPDADLPGNSFGYSTTSAPLDLSGLSVITYDPIRIRGTLTTTKPSQTPSIYDWRVSYKSGPVILPDINFDMVGAKTIGTDASGDPVYKFSTSTITNASGTVAFTDIEWDTYTITIDAAEAKDIAHSCGTQPFSLLPDVTATTSFLLEDVTSHSLHVTVVNAAGDYLSRATVRLYRPSFDETQKTGSCGQTFFKDLSPQTFDVDVTASGYTNKTVEDIAVSGAVTTEITMN